MSISRCSSTSRSGMRRLLGPDFRWKRGWAPGCLLGKCRGMEYNPQFLVGIISENSWNKDPVIKNNQDSMESKTFFFRGSSVVGQIMTSGTLSWDFPQNDCVYFSRKWIPRCAFLDLWNISIHQGLWEGFLNRIDSPNYYVVLWKLAFLWVIGSSFQAVVNLSSLYK